MEPRFRLSPAGGGAMLAAGVLPPPRFGRPNFRPAAGFGVFMGDAPPRRRRNTNAPPPATAASARTPMAIGMSGQGTLDKVMGDGLMATFGVPVSGSADAARALRCARGMLRAIEQWNAERQTIGLDPIRIGIGIHTGRIMLGTIGEVRRMENTVISDTVNAASRIESMTKKLSAGILLSGEALAQIPKDDYIVRLVDVAQPRGKTQTLEIFELLNPLSENRRTLLLSYEQKYRQALMAMREGNLTEARAGFEDCQRVCSDDGAVLYHLRLLAKMALLKKKP